MLSLFRQPIMSTKLCLSSVPSFVVVCTSSIAIYLITMEDLISSQHRLPATIRHFFVVIRLLHNGPRYTDPGTQIPAQWLFAPQNIPQKVFITINFHISMQYKLVIRRTGACRGVSIKNIDFTGGSQGIFIMIIMVHHHLISPTRHGCTAHSEIRYLGVWKAMKSILSIQEISLTVCIFYIDRKEHWKHDRLNHQYLCEYIWYVNANDRLFSQCDHFGSYTYVCVCACGCGWGWGLEGGGGGVVGDLSRFCGGTLSSRVFTICCCMLT